MSEHNESHSAPNASWPVIGAVIAAMSVFTLTLGLSYPLLAFILESMGTPKSLIGFNAAMTPLGIIVSAPIMPRLARKRGSWELAFMCLVATLVFFTLIGATRNIAIWFVLRFCMGISINGIFVVNETWINQLADNASRGRVMGIYVTVMSLGFCVGPFILPFTGFDGWPPFMVGIISFVIAGFVMLPLRKRTPQFTEKAHGSIYRFILLAPVLSLAVFSVAYFDQVVLSFLPLYALHYGLSEGAASFALGVLILGNVFLQIPMGWLVDRTSRHKVMLLCTLITLVGCGLLPVAIGIHSLLWPMLFIWGGAAFGVYTIALAGLGDRFTGAMLLIGNAAFGLMWGVGGIVGPASVGIVMQFWSPEVLPLALGIPFIPLAFMLLRRRADFRAVSSV